jgi:hypothetical protein
MGDYPMRTQVTDLGYRAFFTVCYATLSLRALWAHLER